MKRVLCLVIVVTFLFSGIIIWPKDSILITEYKVNAASNIIGGPCGNNLTYTYDSNTYTLSISGQGDMKNYSSSTKAPWNNYTIKKLVIGSEVTSIGAYAFYGIKDLKSIEIPGSIKIINNDAFFASGLETIVFNEGLQKIGIFAFSGCDIKGEVYFPKSLQSIGDFAFYRSEFSNKVNFIIPKTVKELGVGAICCSGNTKTVRAYIYCDENSAAYSYNSTKKTSFSYYNYEYYNSHRGIFTAYEKAIQFKYPYLNILEHNINKYTVSIENASYTGSTVIPELKLYKDNWILKEGKDYTVEFTNNINIGYALATITATGDYEGKIETSFKITPASINNFKYSISPKSLIYNGKIQCPNIQLKDDFGNVLIDNTDYYISGNNNCDAGNAYIYINGKGCYTGKIKIDYTIEPYYISEKNVAFSLDNSLIEYNGTPQNPSIISLINTELDKELEIDKDYIIVKYSDNINVGTGSIIIEGKGNYTGTVSKNYNIIAAPIEDTDVVFNETSFVYNGKAIEPIFSVKVKGRILKKDVDYSVTYLNNTSIGTGSVIITGVGNYSGIVTKYFNITDDQHQFGDWLTTKAATCTTDGTQTRKCSVCGKTETKTIAKTGHKYTTKVVAPTTTAQGYTLHICSVCGHSYTDNYSPLHTHSYTSKVTKAATCAATGVRTYTCSCGDSYTETIPKTAHKYTEKVIAPTTSAQGYTFHTCSVCGASYKDNYTDKVHTHNYTSQVTRTATCAATGIRTYTCSCGDTYTETIPKTAHNYTEKVIAPTYEAQGYTLHTCSVCGNSYKDNYTDKLAVHTHSYTSKVTKAATCAATGIRTYTCSCGDSYTEIIPMAEHNYTAKTVAPTYTAQGYTQHTCSVCGDSYKDTYTAKLTPKTESISKATVTGIGAKTYTGKAITQSPVVKLSGKTLKAGTDYTVAYKNNTKVGTATVTITGKGSYTGTISKTFKINAASIAKATVSGISNKTYTGKAITQNPTVKLGSKTLKKGTDYTVSYKNNKAVGKATVTIKGKGNYTGTISKTFKINPKKTTLKTATSPKTKQLKVTYSKVSGVTGYQTVYSTSSKFTKATTKTASSKSTSKTISGLTKGKTYYVKVRTYKTVNGTKYYSGYSAVKKKKIK